MPIFVTSPNPPVKTGIKEFLGSFWFAKDRNGSFQFKNVQNGSFSLKEDSYTVFIEPNWKTKKSGYFIN